MAIKLGQAIPLILFGKGTVWTVAILTHANLIKSKSNTKKVLNGFLLFWRLSTLFHNCSLLFVSCYLLLSEDIVNTENLILKMEKQFGCNNCNKSHNKHRVGEPTIE